MPALDYAYVGQLDEAAEVCARSEVFGCVETGDGEERGRRAWRRGVAKGGTLQMRSDQALLCSYKSFHSVIRRPGYEAEQMRHAANRRGDAVVVLADPSVRDCGGEI